MALDMHDIDVQQIDPNPWNPNRQNEREFAAELESITTFGFIDPVLLRRLDDRFQIIDGEHRWRAAMQLELTSVPAIVIVCDDVQARKLTVVMNETRGKADPALLGKLFAELHAELGDLDALTHALPFDDRQIKDLMELAAFDWDAIETPSDESFDGHAPSSQQITCVVSLAVAARWGELRENFPGELPTSAGAANGAVLQWLIERTEGEA